ncbi:TniQ family protein [Actinacidiphila oryziradicis]|uniref:TniQ domain-containing protein n=1 Tax=Actinacidiphila oryziradicis TaxID=2571141 RepID=A0A4U0SJL0_9ACTN|nr:hypothetical protein FCI23_28195 [Actinacidiphila oryziradicis]
MSPLRPLPRSLAPLPDESLVGFLLRLAHHNNVSPGTIVRHTGLSSHWTGLTEHLSISQQYLQTPEQSAEFVRTTRLGEDEVANLFLAPFGARFGPLDATLIRRPRGPILHGNHDVFRRWSRFCPHCLAGDSGIERAHGGSWKRLWRLPPVFACPVYRCLLRHNCAKCGHLGRARPGLCAPAGSPRARGRQNAQLSEELPAAEVPPHPQDSHHDRGNPPVRDSTRPRVATCAAWRLVVLTGQVD